MFVQRVCPKPALYLIIALLRFARKKMDPGPPRLQRRNVEVFDSDGAVIAGTSFPSDHIVCGVDIAVRILAVRHSPVGRVS
jgi:hypothetical protein